MKMFVSAMKTLNNWFYSLSLLLVSNSLFAKSSDTLGTMASSITSSLKPLTQLVTAGSYIAGLGFAIGAILKFKQHKENPTQVELGKPVTFLLVAAALLFLPSVLDVAGGTLFGSSGGQTAGPSGMVYTSS